MKMSMQIREALKGQGYGRTAISVRAREEQGGERIYISVKDLAIPLQRVEQIARKIAPERVKVQFDYCRWNEAVKAYISTAQEIMTKGEHVAVFENDYCAIVYQPILSSLVLEKKSANNQPETVEITQARNAYEVAEAYFLLKNKLAFLTWQATEQAAEDRKKGFAEMARRLKTAMQMRRANVRATLKDLVLLMQCFSTGDYNLMKQSKLYQKYGAEYTEYLILLDEMKGVFQK